jgi:hypothetical protein
MITEESLWQTLFEATEPFQGYKKALEKLSAILPPGYALCFAFNYVDADICNGGISQLYANPTWSLILVAVEACRRAKATRVEQLLREVVLYYYERGRSRHKRRLTEEFFAGLARPLGRSLSELEEAYFALEDERYMVVPRLLADPSLWNNG